MAADIATALIAAGGATILAVITYGLTKKREREADLRKERLAHYKDFVASLSGIITGEDTPDGQRAFAKACNNLNLVAPQQAIQALHAFQEEIRASNSERNRERHDRLLSRLLFELRRDLGIWPRDSKDFQVGLWASGIHDKPETAAQLKHQPSDERPAVTYEELLYLDLDFLADKYEDETGIAPKTVISKNEGMDAQASITFLKSGLHSQVTRQFTTSSQAMFKAVTKTLGSYPKHEPNLNPGQKPTNAWVKGHLTIGRWGSESNSEQALNVFFEIKSGEHQYSLLPKDEYFLANIEALEIISPALQRWIQIPVRMLCKVLYPLPDIQTFVVTPYLICAANGESPLK
ncbi:hypothetical protein [Tahibacter caeni]|uniref:hypothetical protein n=1 Tax=Tahibacter caeni TaxID=1453545 RepID=UPI0021488E3D|nr:hypothetical protein [Tahibacter caeni]